MNNQKIKSSDFGSFEPDFLALISRYKLEEKKEDILKYAAEAILGKTDEVAMAEKLISDLKLDFGVAADFAYDLRVDILEKIKKEEIEAIKKNIKDREAQEYSPLAISDELIKKIGYKPKDKVFRKRFDDAIFSYLKDIRDMEELEDILTRSTKIGGVGLSKDAFYDLENLLIDKKKEISEKGVDMAKIISDYESQFKSGEFKDVKEEEIDVAAKPERLSSEEGRTVSEDVTIDKLLQAKGIEFEKLSRKEEIKKDLLEKEDSFAPQARAWEDKAKEGQSLLAREIEEKEDFLESKEEIAPPPVIKEEIKKETEPKEQEAVKETGAVLPAAMPQPQTPPSQTKPLEPEEKQPFLKKSFPAARPRVEDVKFASKLYGPIDELAAFKIEDLRRLSKNPQEAVNKIKDKLELLEEESLIKRIEGIKALKASPLYKIYADIMNKAIKEGKPFDQVLQENPVLSPEEFKAIMELNKSLKY
ncbi:MAG TPA: hypothetical protein ENN28_00765 [Candidatus Uhrbacteria bacterium]|nr:hypothetical protein [Candidatus Uhrbacteria bacterium]